ncbi:MAG: MaoC family dehydratase N-terminal domain-containing protein [Alcanivoracaceae bacterium]|jgi:acyl dehydratase|nr:MaoC family dehydratase N-terminal domain-containing protein [Alcanivoracaceae bacterium]
MINTKHIGLQLPTVTFEVEKGRLRFFAKATGETRPEYLDEQAARAAGYRSLPVPPTFLMGADLDAGTLTTLLDTLGVPIERILHGEQSFTYHAPVCAGDVLSVESKVSDIYSKKGGAIEFIVKDSQIKDAQGETVVEARSVIVVRNPQENAA